MSRLFFAFLATAFAMMLPFDAQAFNIVMVYDPFFRHWILVEIPAMLCAVLVVLSTIAIYPQVKNDVSLFRFVTQHVVGHFIAIYLNILLLIVLGSLMFSSLNEGEDLVVWVALIYFYCMFVYVGWWIGGMSLGKALKKPCDKEVIQPYRFVILVMVAVCYGVAYYHVISELRF